MNLPVASNLSAADEPALRRALAATDAPFEHARTLPAAVYTDPALFACEQRSVFATMWLAVARSEDLPDAGSFITRELAGEKILIVRGRDAVVRAFFNVCRHRGARLVDEAGGRIRGRITCPYHAWSYELDGTLDAVPRAPDTLAMRELALVPVRIETFMGQLFVNLDPQARPLAQAFADLPDLTRYRVERLVRARSVAYELAANWKIVCENYSECYHCPHVHPPLNRLSDLTSGAFESGACFNGGPMLLREGFTTMSSTGHSQRAPLPGLGEADRHLVRYYHVYPNVMFALHPDYVLTHTVWPLAPDRSRVECAFLFAPEELARPGFDADDAVSFWDRTNREDWDLCERVQQGAASRGYRPGPYHPTERCVHAFDQWYARTLLAAGQ